MRIKELNIAEFGCFKNKKITLDSGLNIIEGDNESGKSTLVLFIKFMLYGLGRKNAKNFDRERAFSFDGRRAAGSMLVECDGKDYLIERRASMGTRSEALTVTELCTGSTLDGEPGEVLLGVPAEVFESSAYVAQMKAAAVGNSQTATQIENMLVSADENIDVARILEKIDKVRKEYRLNRGEGGRLYESEQQLASLRAKQRDVTEKHLVASEMEAKLIRLEQNIKKVSESYTASKRMLDDLTNARILQRFDELDLNTQKLSSLKNDSRELSEGVCQTDFLPDRAHNSALLTAARRYADAEKKLDVRKYELDSLPTLDEDIQGKAAVGERIEAAGGKNAFLRDIVALGGKASKKRAIGVVSASVGVLCAVLALLTLGGMSLIAVAVAVCALLCGGAAFTACFVSANKKQKQCRAKCEELGVPFDELDAYADSCVRALSEVRAAESSLTAQRVLYASARQDMSVAADILKGLLQKTLKIQNDGDSLVHLAESEYKRLEQFCAENERLDREIYAYETMVGGMNRELEAYDREALRAAVHTDISTLTPEAVERARTKERFDRDRLEKLANEEKIVRESLIALKAGLIQSPVELADSIGALEARYAADMEYYNALMLAKEYIEKASTSMTAGVTPDIARRAGELMSALSGGAHSSVQTTKSLGLSLEQDGFFVSSDLVSGGTRDAAYICLRIALMWRMYGENIPPLILDESLCQLDDTRAQRLLASLAGLSQSMQCLLLSCHTREAEICRALGLECNKIELE